MAHGASLLGAMCLSIMISRHRNSQSMYTYLHVISHSDLKIPDVFLYTASGVDTAGYRRFSWGPREVAGHAVPSHEACLSCPSPHRGFRNLKSNPEL